MPARSGNLVRVPASSPHAGTHPRVSSGPQPEFPKAEDQIDSNIAHWLRGRTGKR